MRVSLARFRFRVGLHIVLFEVCSAFTRVAACTLARSPIRDRYPRASDISSPPCLPRLLPAGAVAGWALHPLEKRRLVTAHVGTRHCRRYWRKIAPVMARSMTKGAVIASWRNPARKVIVFQCPPCTRPTTRLPRLARPRKRAMLVEVPVSSRKTSRAGSRPGCSAFQAARASATSGRSCSLACTIFFKADALGGEETPHRPLPDIDAPPPKLGADLFQR